jgi:hypothetical protein
MSPVLVALSMASHFANPAFGARSIAASKWSFASSGFPAMTSA